MKKRILAIGAHPDDIEIGCAGFLQKASHPHLLILSHGECGGDADIRIKEAASASKLLGATISLYDLPDTAIEARFAMPIIEKEIKDFSPDIILTMAKTDTHQDHVAVYEATKTAVREENCTVLSYMGPSSAEFYHPTWFVPMDEQEMGKKLEAISCHASQDKRKYLTKAYITGAGSYWAMITKSNFLYVEPFEVIQHWEK